MNTDDPQLLWGANVVGMEMGYPALPAPGWPVADQDYPVHDARLIDYLADHGMTAIRLLFSWEAVQPALFGPIPDAEDNEYVRQLHTLVEYATTQRGMHVVIEPWQSDPAGHAGGARWRGQRVGSAAVPVEAWQDFWTRLAGAFAESDDVGFGLVNEPNHTSTMRWWAIAQAGVDAIRGSGATQRIYVPGNGYTSAGSWTDDFYDTAPTKRSNAYGWLNANGPGQPITDPANNIVVEVHTYLDPDQGGGSTEISSVTAARDHLAVVVDEARAQGYRVWLGEIGMYAGEPGAAAAWADFVDYAKANADVLIGVTWWAAGAPGWWDDVAAGGGGHFAITPTDPNTFTGDTVNMTMIDGSF